jgi:hypothetical protein
MMKIKLFAILLIAITSLQSCCFYGDCNDDDGGIDIIEPTSNYTAVIMERTQFEESVTLLPPKPIVNSGKIYVIGNLLFVNEKNEGFHVFSNEDPSNPIALNFINTPGATDISIRDGVYYINQAVDLIAITYARSSELYVSKRIRDVFPSLRSPDGFYFYELGENEVVVNWILNTGNY